MKKSVCMATYNGSKYIQKQILSILQQLKDDDELIIVDDHSTDNTIDIIRSFNDPRIVLIQNTVNQGVVKTFEKSLKYSSGDLIFLSDQDDIWLPYKILELEKRFLNDPELTLIVHDAQIIDKNDNVIFLSFYKKIPFKKEILPNIIKNTYIGCSMAFRSKMIPLFLPFPDDIPMHDGWIGMINELYGKTLYIDETLIQRRLHDANYTSVIYPSRSSLIQKIKWRIALIKNLVLFVFIKRAKENKWLL